LVLQIRSIDETGKLIAEIYNTVIADTFLNKTNNQLTYFVSFGSLRLVTDN